MGGFYTKPILTTIYKNVLLPHHNNSLIYMFKSSCGSPYIGRTNQRLDARIKQHVPMKIRDFISGLTDNHGNKYGPSKAEHLINNHDFAEIFSVDLFSILGKSHPSFHLKV